MIRALPFPKRGRRAGNRRGMALVITLAALFLLTSLLLAFFSRARLNRLISYSSSNQVKADLLAHAALDIVVGEIRQEIVDGSAPATPVAGGQTFYPPKAPSAAASYYSPQAAGVSNADTALGAYLLAKNAADRAGLYPGSPRPLGSAVRIDQASANGRKLANWYATGPQFGTADLPSWVYLTRENGVAVDPAATQAASPTSANYVIGRFTYSVYNTAGLLDANVAGFPAAGSGLAYSVTNTLTTAKGFPAYADLTALGLTQAQVGTLVAWRNRASGPDMASFDEWASGIARASGTSDAASLLAARSGHLSVAAGDQAFLSRREFLRYASLQGWGATAPSYFTHFSRSAAGPTWRPTVDAGGAYNYKSNADQSASANRNLLGACFPAAGTVTHYRDDGITEAVTVTAGTPAALRRFSLAKLAWIGLNGPNAAAFDPSLSATDRANAVRDCFGLVWNAAALRWDYATHWNTSDHSIKTLAQVVAETAPREPDFFELLKAVVLSGSLGRDPGKAANGPFLSYGSGAGLVKCDDVGVQGLDFDAYSAAADMQVAQIGVNLIDQAGAGNYPTAVYLQLFVSKASYSADENAFFNTAYGIKNLPYLMQMGQITAQDGTTTSTTMSSWLQPELWNPHQDLTALGYPAASSPQYASPAELRLVPYGQCYLMNVATSPVGNGALVDYESNPVAHAVYFHNHTDYFKLPTALTSAYQSSAFSTDGRNLSTSGMGGGVSFASNPFLGIYCGTAPRPSPDTPGSSNMLINAQSPMTFALEYYDGTNWRPYSFMARVSAFLTQSLASASKYGLAVPKALAARPDPRTDRFSVSSSAAQGAPAQWPVGTTIRKDASTTAYLVFGYPRTTSGFTYNTTLYTTPGDSSMANQQLYYDQWAANLSTTASNCPYYADPDGVVRPGDSSAADYATGNGVITYHSTVLPGSAAFRRPVVLNRPFRSVGEIGYAFRDQPFKSLDLRSPGSADAGLLDVFSVADEPAASAGSVNPNAMPKPVLAALLAGAGKSAADATQTIDAPTAAALGAGIAAYLAGNAGKIGNRADLVTGLGPTIQAALADPSYRSKAPAEAPVRALASQTDTRTWNLLVDVTAQTGVMTPNAADLGSFIVQGEKRYWLHLAIDRYTDKIVSEQFEPAYD